MVTPHQRDDGILDSREDMGTGSSEKSYGADGILDSKIVEKEQGPPVDEDAAAAAATRSAVVERKVDVPPNGGYGWVCVAACATINAYVACRQYSAHIY